MRRIPAIDWRTTKTRSTVDSSDVRLGSNWTFSGRIYPVFYIRKSYQVALDSSGFIYFLILFYLFLFCLDWVTRERKCRSRNERVRPSNGICQRILRPKCWMKYVVSKTAVHPLMGSRWSILVVNKDWRAHASGPSHHILIRTHTVWTFAYK